MRARRPTGDRRDEPHHDLQTAAHVAHVTGDDAVGHMICSGEPPRRSRWCPGRDATARGLDGRHAAAEHRDCAVNPRCRCRGRSDSCPRREPPLRRPRSRRRYSRGARGYGWRHTSDDSVLSRRPRSGILVRASTTAPARRIFSTTGASHRGHELGQSDDPGGRVPRHVDVGLDGKGNAVKSAEASPERSVASARSASASTSSGRTSTTALMSPIDRIDAGEVRLDDFARRDLPDSNELRERQSRLSPQISIAYPQI